MSVKPSNAPASRFYLSPVDYEAWGKGYTPPSEHVLIDALAHRGARVVSSSHMNSGGWWLVTTPDMKLSRKVRLQVFAALDDDLMDALTPLKKTDFEAYERALSPTPKDTQ